MFKSFFLAGFESASGYNLHRQWIDQVAATQHDKFMEEDYSRLAEAGIRAARDAVRWPLVDRGGRYDWSTVDPLLKAARENGVEVIFDLFHYGYPDDVDLFSDRFPERFADYCFAAARYIRDRMDGVLYFTPINEPSYFSWAGGEVGWFAPHTRGRGGELKVALARGLIRGIDAIRAAVPDARIVNVDPICRVVAPHDRPDLTPDVEYFNDKLVFEALDMVMGRLRPELGGSPAHLDIVGLNYYWTNQWVLGREGTPLAADDPRLLPLSELVLSAWQRYGADLIISETSHVNEMRPLWVRELSDEAEKLLDAGVPLHGVCLYPILGMPEWHAQEEWTRLGLWDVHPEQGRVIYEPMFDALRLAQARLEKRRDQWTEPVLAMGGR